MDFVATDELCVDLGATVNQLRQQLRQFEQAVHACRQKESTYEERLRALGQTENQATEQIEALETELGQLQTELIDLDPQSMQAALDERSEEHTSELQSRGHLVC